MGRHADGIQGGGGAIEPVRRTLTLACPPEHAWSTFTERLADWWPLHLHSRSAGSLDAPARTATLEGRAGGRVYEVMADGREADWGRVEVWEPPRRLVVSWNPSSEERPPSEWELRFSAEGDGTLLDLEHRAWRDEDRELRDSYEGGWGLVLGAFAEAVGASSRA
jgi:uncharacterized protein YndB with AHSA1/START domain